MRLTLNRLFLSLLTLSAPLPLLAANGHYVPGIEASGGAATAVDGKMVDTPVVEQARRILGRMPTAPH